MTNKDFNVLKIAKFLNDDMSSDELEGFKEMLKVKNNKDVLNKYIITNHYKEVKKNHFDADKAFRVFTSKNIKQQKIKKHKLNTQPFLKYAALFLAPLALLYFYTTYNNDDSINIDSNLITLQLNDGSVNAINEDESRKIINNDGIVIGIQKHAKMLYNYSTIDTISNEKREIEINLITVPRGKRFEVVLSDGTHVQLNSESTLKYPTVFTVGEERVVELTGEAYFNVTKNKNSAFIVKTNDLTTKVLGTEFNVMAYKEELFSTVVLVEGSVSIFKEGNSIDGNSGVLLVPGQKAMFSSLNKSLEISNTIVQNHIAWLDGILLFENLSFKTISRKLERFYNVNIYNNYVDLAEEKFTGQFDIESVEDVFNTFRKNTPFEFTIENNEININPENQQEI